MLTLSKAEKDSQILVVTIYLKLCKQYNFPILKF